MVSGDSFSLGNGLGDGFSDGWDISFKGDCGSLTGEIIGGISKKDFKNGSENMDFGDLHGLLGDDSLNGDWGSFKGEIIGGGALKASNIANSELLDTGGIILG